MALVAYLVHLAQELDRFKVLPASKLVGNPLALLPRVIPVDHGSHRIHSQAIDVVLVQPEQGIRDEKIRNFVAPEIED